MRKPGANGIRIIKDVSSPLWYQYLWVLGRLSVPAYDKQRRGIELLPCRSVSPSEMWHA